MTRVEGLFKDSGNNIIVSGGLKVKLDAPIYDVTTDPATILIPVESDFSIVNGELPLISPGVKGINLIETATKNITYTLSLYLNTSDTKYFYYDGDNAGLEYEGAVHTYLSNPWTGVSHTADSKRLDSVIQTSKVIIDSFQTIIPNVVTVDYYELLPTRISTDRLPIIARQVAEILVGNTQYLNLLTDPRYQGFYSPTTFYKTFDEVGYGGSSWIYVNPVSTQGNAPFVGSSYWQLRASKGDPGGTGGTDTPYDPTGWNGATFAPTANAIRDVIVTLAPLTALNGLAPLVSPTFTTPFLAANPANSSNTLAIPSTSWVRTNFAPLDSATATGTWSFPTQPVTDASNKPATTKFVDDYSKAKQFGLIVVERQTVNQSLTTNTYVQVNWNTEILDTYNTFASSVFTVPSDGWYKFTVNLSVTSTAPITLYEFALFSGSTRLNSFLYTDTNSTGFVSVSAPLTMQLTAGQTINVRIKAVSTGTLAIYTSAETLNQLTVEKVALI